MVANSHPDRWRSIMRRRVILAASVMALWGVAIEARLVHLQVLRHDDLVERAVRQRSRTIDTHPKRGEILDREGRVLAYSVDADTVVAVPSEIADPVDTTRRLCLVLECSDERRKLIETRLGRDRLFAYVQRHVSVDAAKQIRELELPGVGLLKENRRFYPNKELAAHLIGYVGIDNQGLHGLESLHDKAIGGQPGKVLVQTDAHNRAFSRVERPPTTGVTLELTIDKYIQHIAERELRRAVLEHDAAGGSVVVMDPHTGDIFALANAPTFNPNAFLASTADLRRNRATQDVYEPGSTFKIVTASAALEEGVFHPDQVIDVSPGVIYFGGRPIRDIGRYGKLTFADVIVKSSNVGASKIGVALGAERLGRYVRRFGFGQTFARDFPGQSRGIVHDPSTLGDSALARVSMGYSISVTPLQMATAMSVIANGGELVAPRLVRAQLSADGRQEVPVRVIRRAISERTASTLTRIMEDVVSRGTARRARVPGYTVAGKTGTSEKILPGGGYSKTDHVASFGGFVPSTRPELTILVVVDDVARFGGLVAAPVFQRIAEAVLRHRGTLPNVDAPPPILVGAPDASEPAVRTVAVSAPMSEPVSPIGTDEGRMPDLVGMSARTALQTVTELGLTTQVSGRGFVSEQWPAAEEFIVDGQAVTLRLERFSTNGSRTGS
ncbi:MAG: penicillin-binding protein [Acidobacteriota bacterium]|nr:penicillin-binding protein [Acidobacteriota bacterium]